MEAIKLQRNDHGRGFIYYDPDEKEQRYNCWELLDESLYQALENLQAQLKKKDEEIRIRKAITKIDRDKLKRCESQLKEERKENKVLKDGILLMVKTIMKLPMLTEVGYLQEALKKHILTQNPK